ncbi:hypothetical protein [Pontibacillus litoralis]|uniref:Uncharacterized protein n=1 Tax=Pontibacillus litoralis JSM 072002 TaxID=1385512 RepID=A0A0A5G7D3_9BACI|nr:hypothetical protein [Pontibacillus litoralis]KGX87078.1 hypothetical protein N784_02540 [Pontibacillus litoralis JSM 072002]
MGQLLRGVLFGALGIVCLFVLVTVPMSTPVWAIVLVLSMVLNFTGLIIIIRSIRVLTDEGKE